MDNIIARIRSGDTRALEEVYLEFREPFVAWCIKNFASTRDQAVEFYQMSILILYDNICQGKLTELTVSVKSYLFAIGKNKWREYNREKQRTASGMNLELIQMVTEESIDDEKYHDLLQKGLTNMGESGRKILEAFYFQSLKLEEIVIRFGYKNKDAAKTAKYKSLQRLIRIIDSL